MAVCAVTMEELFWTRLDKNGPNGCWTWLGGLDRKGYGRMCVNAKHLFAHRISYEIVHGKLRSEQHCLHKCDNPSCVNPGHLFLGDNAANTADKWAKGRAWSKLKADDVRAIRKSSLPSKDLAAQYGVGYSAIWAIRTGRKWRHVT